MGSQGPGAGAVWVYVRKAISHSRSWFPFLCNDKVGINNLNIFLFQGPHSVILFLTPQGPVKPDLTLPPCFLPISTVVERAEYSKMYQ